MDITAIICNTDIYINDCIHWPLDTTYLMQYIDLFDAVDEARREAISKSWYKQRWSEALRVCHHEMEAIRKREPGRCQGGNWRQSAKVIMEEDRLRESLLSCPVGNKKQISVSSYQKLLVYKFKGV